MNQSLKEAMAASVPDSVPDPRDNLFRSHSDASPIESSDQGPAGLNLSVNSDAEDPSKTQEKQRKTQALQPLA